MDLNISKGLMSDYLPWEIPDGGLTVATNIIPELDGYSNLLSAVNYSTGATSDTPITIYNYTKGDGTQKTFVGTLSKIYRVKTDKSLEDVTRAGDAYATGSNRWYFCQYGDWLLATNFADEIQIIKDPVAGANFSDLAGSPPKCKYMLVYHNHLVLANLASYNKTVQWSAYQDPETWTASLTTGAGSRNLSESDGEITGIDIIGDNLFVWCDRNVHRGWYSSSPAAISFSPAFIKNLGAIPNTCISIGSVAYFIDKSGIYEIDSAGAYQTLGEGIKKSVIATIDTNYSYLISRMHDTQKNVVGWNFCTTGSATPNKQLWFSYKTRSFTTSDMSVSAINRIATGAVDMGSLDSIYPQTTDMPFDLGSSFYAGAEFQTAVLTTDKYLATLTGTALAGTIVTKDFSGKRTVLKDLRTMKDGAGTVTVQVASRMKKDDAVTYGAEVSENTSGYYRTRKVGKYHRVKLNTTGALRIGHVLEAEVKAAEA